MAAVDAVQRRRERPRDRGIPVDGALGLAMASACKVSVLDPSLPDKILYADNC